VRLRIDSRSITCSTVNRRSGTNRPQDEPLELQPASDTHDLPVCVVDDHGIVVINEMLMQLAMMSTILALAFVLGVLWLIFRSVRLAIFTLIPVILVVIWQYSVLFSLFVTGVGISFFRGVEDPWALPYFSGSLNLFTATIGSIITGIGIDFGIHITQRVREKGMGREAVKYAVSTSGLSFVESTTTMICGLVPMMLIPIPIIKEFVVLVTVLLIFSAAGAILVLPAIYTLYFDMEARKKAREELKAAQEAD